MDWVETKENRDEAGGIVECGFHRVHACPGPGCRVVRLVVEAVHFSIEKATNVRNARHPPWVDHPMYDIEVW